MKGEMDVRGGKRGGKRERRWEREGEGCGKAFEGDGQGDRENGESWSRKVDQERSCYRERDEIGVINIQFDALGERGIVNCDAPRP